MFSKKCKYVRRHCRQPQTWLVDTATYCHRCIHVLYPVIMYVNVQDPKQQHTYTEHIYVCTHTVLYITMCGSDAYKTITLSHKAKTSPGPVCVCVCVSTSTYIEHIDTHIRVAMVRTYVRCVYRWRPLLTCPALMTPGHHARVGSLMPPSKVVCLPQRKGPLTPPFSLAYVAAPLSEENTTRVLLSRPCALRASSITPTP